jgi:predicted TIM-barrel enzyme
MGLTTKGTIGAKTAISLEEAAMRVQGIADAAHSIRPEIIVICHGGPISEPEDASFVFAHTHGVHGFFGATSIERLPTELAITAQAARFKALPLNAHDTES